MAASGLKRRVNDLEARGSGRFKAWHRIIQHIGETQEQAIAKYQAEHGSLGDDPHFIVRVVQ